MSRNTRRIGGAVAAVVVALLLWAFVPSIFSGDTDAGPRAEPSAPASTPSIAPTPQVESKPVAHTPGNPDRIVIPEIDVDAPVVPIRAHNRVLDPPADPDVIGWWSDGVQPGATQGSALLTGHTVHTGAGALMDLEHLDDGDRITVRTADGDLNYAVTEVLVLSKDELAQRAEELFSQESEGRLVVITCEDWDGNDWQSNVVVTALPA